MAQSVKDFVVELLKVQPTLSNDQVAVAVRKALKTDTTAASVASIKSNAKRDGLLGSTALTNGAAVDELAVTAPEDLPDVSKETREEIAARLAKSFAALGRMTKNVIDGVVPALIVSGPPGLGKSFGLKKALEERASTDPEFKYDYVSGTISAVGLYIALFNMSEGGVVVLDDADDCFADETTLNILKTALDSNDRRVLNWRKQASWLDAEGVPDRFEFEGQVVFLTNIDFLAMADSGKRSAPHFRALMDRSLYLPLDLRSKEDYIVRIEQVVYGNNMLGKYGLTKEEIDEVVAFVSEHRGRFHQLSLRLVHQIALCRMADPENWREDVELTKMRAKAG